MNLLLQFLTVILPQFPQLAGAFRKAFAQVGGDPADFDKILADNQKLIDKLGKPDAYRNKPGTPDEPAPAVFEYDTILTSAPDESRLKSGDGIYGNNKDPQLADRWIVNGGYGRTPTLPKWHLLKTMP